MSKTSEPIRTEMRLCDAPRGKLLRIISHNDVWPIGTIGFVVWFDGKTEVFVSITYKSVKRKVENPLIVMLESVKLISTITKIIEQEAQIQ